MPRSLLVCVTLALLAVLNGCDSGMADKLADAHSRAEQLEAQIEDLRSDLSDLESTVDRFDYDDWKDVVPEVRSKVVEAQGSCDILADTSLTLRSSLEEMESDAQGSDDY